MTFTSAWPQLAFPPAVTQPTSSMTEPPPQCARFKRHEGSPSRARATVPPGSSSSKLDFASAIVCFTGTPPCSEATTSPSCNFALDPSGSMPVASMAFWGPTPNEP